MLGRKGGGSRRRSSPDDSEREILDIRQVLEHYGFCWLPAAEYGWKKIKCFFHGDRSASAVVNFELGAYSCFACDMSGDTIKIIQLAETKEGRSCDYVGALRIYENITGKETKGIRNSAPGNSGGAVAAKEGSYDRDSSIFRTGLRRHGNARRQHPHG